MKPEYVEKYKAKMDESPYGRGWTVGTSVDRALRDLVREVASVEETTASALSFEGITRVLEDRFSDPDFVARVQSASQNYPMISAILEARAGFVDLDSNSSSEAEPHVCPDRN